tara:strand:+ start:28 stop:693 length:666 start_codon:yes stop_codon:yes gene_type:complete
MADEEAQNQEQNAEATEAVEAGAEAVEEAPIQEPKAPSVLMPMLLSAVVTVAGVGVMVAFILPMQIEKAIAAASDTNGTQAQVQKDGDEKKGEGDEKKEDADETADPTAEPDDPKKPVAIVPEGESIVVNPANSGGTRYILVEIFLLREDEKDTGFPKAVESKTKQLQATTMDVLSNEDVQSLSMPSTKNRIKNDIKRRYQYIIGDKHPIKSVIFTKWIMQ